MTMIEEFCWHHMGLVGKKLEKGDVVRHKKAGEVSVIEDLNDHFFIGKVGEQEIKLNKINLEVDA